MSWIDVLKYIQDNKGLIEWSELKETTTKEVISYLFRHGYIMDEDEYIVITYNGALQLQLITI